MAIHCHFYYDVISVLRFLIHLNGQKKNQKKNFADELRVHLE